MNRRGFLSGLAAIAAGATLDPERLLWKPKLIPIPRPRSGNPILTPKQITDEFMNGWIRYMEARDRVIRAILQEFDSSLGARPRL